MKNVQKLILDYQDPCTCCRKILIKYSGQAKLKKNEKYIS